MKDPLFQTLKDLDDKDLFESIKKQKPDVQESDRLVDVLNWCIDEIKEGMKELKK